MDVRDLIRYARRNGWEHITYSFGKDREHVWRCPAWRVSLFRYDSRAWKLFIYRRRTGLGPSWETQVADVTTASVAEVSGVLSALRVLPAEVAA